MAQTNVGLGGPHWANPTGVPVQHQQTTTATPTIGASTADQHESEFFAPLSTLDEPVKETIMRDVRSVVSKLKVVLLPMERSVRNSLDEKLERSKIFRRTLSTL